MIYENVELHNIAEVCPVGGKDGVRLQRIPESVRVHLTEGGQMRALQPDNGEIRFVADGSPVKVVLSSSGETDVTLFYGDFDGRQRFVVTSKPTVIEVASSNPRLQEIDPVYRSHLNFSPEVCRLVLGGRRREPVVLHSVEGSSIRPPKPEELPRLRHLAYGTSITHGFDAEGPHLTYAAQTAWHLGADLINLGLGGSAHCESQLADYIAERGDWDIATLALSVNMQHFKMDEFYKRVSYMVNTVSGKNPDKPVACITLYPYFRDFGIDATGPQFGGTPEEFRQALRDAVSACSNDNVHLIEGPDVLILLCQLAKRSAFRADSGIPF
ncbi:SGNH/GDSL hydrolase family protein [Candidatus Poribacteria bacterium]